MGAPKKSREYKLSFIEAYLDYFKENHPNSKIDDYKEVDDETFEKYYRKVSNCVNEKTQANTAETKADNGTIELTPSQTIQNVLGGYLKKKNITYTEWKEIKELLGKFIVSIEGKMKELAKEELDKAIEERKELNKIIAELEKQAK